MAWAEMKAWVHGEVHEDEDEETGGGVEKAGIGGSFYGVGLSGISSTLANVAATMSGKTTVASAYTCT